MGRSAVSRRGGEARGQGRGGQTHPIRKGADARGARAGAIPREQVATGSQMKYCAQRGRLAVETCRAVGAGLHSSPAAVTRGVSTSERPPRASGLWHPYDFVRWVYTPIARARGWATHASTATHCAAVHTTCAPGNTGVRPPTAATCRHKVTHNRKRLSPATTRMRASTSMRTARQRAAIPAQCPARPEPQGIQTTLLHGCWRPYVTKTEMRRSPGTRP